MCSAFLMWPPSTEAGTSGLMTEVGRVAVACVVMLWPFGQSRTLCLPHARQSSDLILLTQNPVLEGEMSGGGP